MGYKTRRYYCIQCGNWTVRKRQSYDARICADCGIRAMVISTLQMANRSGASWQQWQGSNGPRGRPPKPRVKE